MTTTQRGLAIAVALAVVTAGVILVMRAPSHHTSPVPQGPRDDVSIQDEAILRDPKSDPHLIPGALIRRASHGSELARESALRFARNDSPLLRGGAAEALGYFRDEDCRQTLTKLLSDPDKEVRIRTIRGLSHLPGDTTEKDLLAVLSREGTTDEEKIEIQASLISISPNPQTRASAVRTLIEVASTANEKLRLSAGMKAASMAPQDPAVLDFYRKESLAGRSPALVTAALRHLASFDLPWIAKRFPDLRKIKDLEAQRALIDIIPLVCPNDRIAWLRATVTSKTADRVLIDAAMTAATRLGKGTATELLEAAITAGSLDQKNLERARSLRASIDLRPPEDRCANKTQ